MFERRPQIVLAVVLVLLTSVAAPSFAARVLGCLAILIDSEDDRRATGRPMALAEATRATYARISDLDHSAVLRVLREVS